MSLSSVLQKTLSTRAKRRRSKRERKTLGFETFESREMMSCTPLPLNANGVLTIYHPDMPQTTTFDVSTECIGGVQVTEENRMTTLVNDYSGVREIIVHGSRFNDTITNNTGVKLTAFGNRGNDQITGGSWNDELHGGRGMDILYGRGGIDYLLGDQDDDTLVGGADDDRLEGGSGNDRLDVDFSPGEAMLGSGADYLSGGKNNDTIYLTEGDTIADQLGNDTIIDVRSTYFTISDASVEEGSSRDDRRLKFTITRSPGLSRTDTVSWRTMQVTATAGQDFVSQSGEVSFVNGATKAEIFVDVIGDDIPELEEDLLVQLEAPSQYTTILDGVGRGVIVDDDIDNNTQELRIAAPPKMSEGDSGTQEFVFVVTRSGDDLSQPVSVDYRTMDDSAKDSDNDYEPIAGTLSFDRFASTAEIRVSVNGDTNVEQDEKFLVKLSNPTNGATIAVDSATGTILNDDAPSEIRMTAPQPVIEGHDGIRYAMVTVTRSKSPNQRVEVSYETRDGSAKAYEDYNPVSGTLVFAPNQTSNTIWVPILGDVQIEPDQTFEVRLTDATNSAKIITPSVSVTIKNDDSLSLAAESFTGQSTGPRSWQVFVDKSAAGERAVKVPDEGIASDAPSLDYRVNVGTAGRYYVWVLGRATNGGNNSVHVELKGSTSSTASSIQLKRDGIWHWNSQRMRGAGAAYLDIATAGTHTITLKMREDGAEIDHIFLTSNPSYIPTDPAGPVGPGPVDPTPVDRVGVVRDGVFMLDVDGAGNGAEMLIRLGDPADTHLVGDFDGDRVADLALVSVDPTTRNLVWYFDYNRDGVIDNTPRLEFGRDGDVPIIGDWDGNGRDDIAFVRKNQARDGLDWHLDTNMNGVADEVRQYGLLHHTPLVGDWDGDGKDDLTAVERSGGYLIWYLDTAGDGQWAEETRYLLVSSNYVPMVGDWNRDGKDDMAVVGQEGAYLYWYFDLNDGADVWTEQRLLFGLPGDQLIVGNW